MDAHNQLRLLGRSHCACTVSVKCTDDEKNRPFLRCSIRPNLVLIRPYSRMTIAPVHRSAFTQGWKEKYQILPGLHNHRT